MRTLEDIAQEIAEKEQALRESITSYEVVALARHKISREILELRIKMKDLDTPLEKGKNAKELLRSELRELKDLYWSTKNG